MPHYRIKLILFFILISRFCSYGQELNIKSGLQKLSSGNIWFELRQHNNQKKHPTIVFESGALSNSNYWNTVIETIANYANTLRYDRAGLGRSSTPKDSIRSVIQITNESNELLDSLKIKDKIILVCHSAGGFYGQAFSGRFGSKVQALVLIETPCTKWESILRSSLSTTQNKERDAVLKVNRQSLSLTERQEYNAAEFNKNFLNEMKQLELPIYLIHGIDHNWPEDYDSRKLNQKWKDCQNSLSKISKNSTIIEVPNAGHHVFSNFNLPKFIYNHLVNRR